MALVARFASLSVATAIATGLALGMAQASLRGHLMTPMKSDRLAASEIEMSFQMFASTDAVLVSDASQNLTTVERGAAY